MSKFAFITLVWYLILSFILYSFAASFKYFKIFGASAKDFGLSQVLNEKPNVYMSESDLMPGYLNRLQVPPNSSLASKITYDFSGFFLCK